MCADRHRAKFDYLSSVRGATRGAPDLKRGSYEAARRLRVRAAFLAEAERAAAGRRADARPPSLPPLRADA